MSIKVSGREITTVKHGTVAIRAIVRGQHPVWSNTHGDRFTRGITALSIIDDDGSDQTYPLGPDWTIETNPDYPIQVFGGAARIDIPDTDTEIAAQYSRARYTDYLSPSGDGYLETAVDYIGDAKLSTQVYRRYANDGSGDSGVGIGVTAESKLNIVARLAGVDYLALECGSYLPGDLLRLESTGHHHRLYRGGVLVGTWIDTGNVSDDADHRSLGLRMQGQCPIVDDVAVRQFSPSLRYVLFS